MLNNVLEYPYPGYQSLSKRKLRESQFSFKNSPVPRVGHPYRRKTIRMFVIAGPEHVSELNQINQLKDIFRNAVTGHEAALTNTALPIKKSVGEGILL